MTDTTRFIPDRLQSTLERRLKSWETLLLAVAVAIFIVNSFTSPYFLNAWNLSDMTFNFTEKAMIAFAMALLIISGEIDLSVAAIIALASTAMGAAVLWGGIASAQLSGVTGVGVADPAEAPATAPAVLLIDGTRAVEVEAGDGERGGGVRGHDLDPAAAQGRHHHAGVAEHFVGLLHPLAGNEADQILLGNHHIPEGERRGVGRADAVLFGKCH